MQLRYHLIAVLAVAVAICSAQSSNITTNATASPSSSTILSPCAAVSDIISSYSSANPEATSSPAIPPSTALSCLQSVPLDVNASSALVDYLVPYLQFQSTIVYLLNPPTGYLLQGVDIFGGLAEIKENLQNAVYRSQWEFEADLYILLNVKPHEGHLAFPLPVIGTFSFGTGQTLVSVSDDGVSVPQVFLFSDLQLAGQASTNSSQSWTPSPIISIDSKPISNYLQTISMMNNNQDPDSLYNTLFTSIPFVAQGGGSGFGQGAYPLGVPTDSSSFLFANGTCKSFQNYAIPQVDFTGVDSGEALFSVVEFPAITSSATATSTATPQPTVPGYPNPVIKHPENYVSGYFLNSPGFEDIAVLVVSSFEGQSPSADLEMQDVVQIFLAECTGQGKTRLIIDLSANGGGDILTGYDLFKQLFPQNSIYPFDGTRIRATPAVNYLGQLITTSTIYNSSLNYDSNFQVQSYTDVNLQPFSNWSALFGPVEIYGDEFTSELRLNLNAAEGDFVVSGYGNRSDIPPQPFDSENIIMVYDGYCASTCTIFSELMKNQGNVRSVALGGRPQAAPMQGLGGTKGAQNMAWSEIQNNVGNIADIINIIKTNNGSVPSPPSSTWIPSTNSPPLGAPFTQTSPLLNFQNQYKQGDDSQTPLQFIYEASNCRLFYTQEDLFDITVTWTRVASVAWGDGTCVPGSTLNSNNTISVWTPANATVPFDPSFVSNFSTISGPGNVIASMSNITNTSISSPKRYY